MTHVDPIRQRILAIAEPVCNAAGFELVDVRFKAEPGGWVLRVFIDVALEEGATVDLTAVPEDRVDLSACEQLSRELSAVLDVEDPIPHAYNLEISSPGIDRPLRTPTHFRRYVGAEIKVALAMPLVVASSSSGPGERRNFRGRLVGVEGDEAQAVAVVEVDGQPFRLPIADIDTARIVPDWDAVMRGGSGVGPSAAPVKPSKQAKPGSKSNSKEKSGGARR